MAFYLSPRVMYHRFVEADTENRHFYAKYSYLTQTLQKSYEIYNLCTKQYAGFGTLLQFVPGTKQISRENSYRLI